MTYQVLDQGFVYKCEPDVAGRREIAITSRAAVTRDGRVLCSFMTQTELSSNDFVPYLSVSDDGGRRWRLQGAVWPHLRDAYSMNPSISRSQDGELFLFGSRTPRVRPGESFWCQETLGILPNKLIWARSKDNGQTWTDPQPVKLPLPGAAETPAPLCVMRSGRWIGPYSPHNTFDPNLDVDLRHVVAMISDDEGKSWRHTSAIRVHESDAYVAEAWIIELSDGTLLSTAWHLHRGPGDDHPNVYALSSDGGDTWSPTRSTGIPGQSTGLAALPDGRALFVYNQRRHGTPGVWLAVAKPSVHDFGVLANDIVWRAAIPTQNSSSGKSLNWTDFAFGEPSVTVLPDGTFLILFWCIQPDGSGIRFVKLKMT